MPLQNVFPTLKKYLTRLFPHSFPDHRTSTHHSIIVYPQADLDFIYFLRPNFYSQYCRCNFFRLYSHSTWQQKVTIMVQLPRRHAQRQAVRRRQQRNPAKSQMLSRERLKRKSRTRNGNLHSSDGSDSAEEPDTCSESDRDSECSPELDVKNFFTQKIAQHKENGPTMANHSERTKDMIETGRAYFYEYVWQI